MVLLIFFSGIFLRRSCKYFSMSSLESNKVLGKSGLLGTCVVGNVRSDVDEFGYL